MNAAILSGGYLNEDRPRYNYGVGFGGVNCDESPSWRVYGLAALLVLAVGTGGQCDSRYIQGRQTLGYPVPAVEVREEAVSLPRSAAADLKQIRAAFQVSISDLAALFGVTRQTIYDWLSGGQQPREPHLVRMTVLLDVASAIEAAGFAVSRRALKQVLADGRSLFDRVRADESLADAADQLVMLFRREALQRETLEYHLANRSGASVDLVGSGVPHLHEDL